MPEIREISQISHLIDDHVGLRCDDGGANGRRVEPIGDRGFRAHTAR